MIGLQNLILKQNIKIVTLEREMKYRTGIFYDWFKNNKIPIKYLKELSEKFDVSEEYLNEKVNDISTYKPKGVRELNKYEIRGDTTVIFMPMRTGIILETLIDTEDLQKVLNTNLIWHGVWDIYSKSYYAKATAYKQKPSTVSLHRIVMDATDKDIEVDHKNHDTLYNRKYNLRRTESGKNSANRKGANIKNNTGVRNVCYIERDNEYWVQMMKKGERFRWIFPVDQFEEACDFAIKKREELFGEFAGGS